jgi:hypothetical protein
LRPGKPRDPTETGGATAIPAQAASPSRRSKLTSVLDWLTLREAIARAEAEPVFTNEQRDALRRAREASLEADRLLDPPDGSSRRDELAAALYREAAYWLRGAGESEQQPPALEESPSSFAARAPKDRLSTLSDAQRWVHQSLERRKQSDVLGRLKAQRSQRLLLALVLLAALLLPAGVSVGRLWRGPDLASGKPWRTSSTQDVCHPTKFTCAGAQTAIFFITKEEDRPWYEVDLLTPRRIGRVEVQNRRDTGQDRAVPLVIELSLDGQSYFQVASRTEPFSRWNAEFPRQEARYVRVIVPRQSTLHLERVSVRP